MIATVIRCYKRAFSGVLEGVALKNFLEGVPRIPSFSLSSSATILRCILKQCAYVSPISVALGDSDKLANSSSPRIGLSFSHSRFVTMVTIT